MEKPTSLQHAPQVGRPVLMESGLRRILAPNASPMTHWGTNTYLLGHDVLAVIDPGPDDAAHLDAILAAIGSATVSHILVTHSHLDHSPLARRLAGHVGAPVLAFGDSAAGRSVRMQRLLEAGPLGGGEGIDMDFQPDDPLADAQVIETSDWTLRALHTPGHMGNHMAFDWNGRLFTGDLVMGWASTMVSPPDGDLTDFLCSCLRLRELSPTRLYPGHGAPVDDATGRIDWLIAHRKSRTDDILQALAAGPMDVNQITKSVYHDAPPALRTAASRNVLAHLIDLETTGQVWAKPALSPEAVFGLNGG